MKIKDVNKNKTSLNKIFENKLYKLILYNKSSIKNSDGYYFIIKLLEWSYLLNNPIKFYRNLHSHENVRIIKKKNCIIKFFR